MGTQSSLPDRHAHNSSRSPSPLLDPTDGLARIPSTMPSLADDGEDGFDGLPRFSTQPKAEKKKKKRSKTKHAHVGSPPQPAPDIQEEGADGGEDYEIKVEAGQAHPAHQPRTNPSAADRDPKPEPSTPKKAKRSRTSKTRATINGLGQHHTSDIPTGSHDSDRDLDRTTTEGAGLPAITSSTKAPSSGGKRGKEKGSKTKEAAFGPGAGPLDESDEDGIVPPSSSRKRRPSRDSNAGIGQKESKEARTSSSVVQEHRDAKQSTRTDTTVMGQGLSTLGISRATVTPEGAPENDAAAQEDLAGYGHVVDGDGRSESPLPASPLSASPRLEVVLHQRGAGNLDAPAVESDPSPDTEIPTADGDVMDVDEASPESAEDLEVQDVTSPGGSALSSQDERGRVKTHSGPAKRSSHTPPQASKEGRKLLVSSNDGIERDGDSLPSASKKKATPNGRGSAGRMMARRTAKLTKAPTRGDTSSQDVTGVDDAPNPEPDAPSNGDEQADLAQASGGPGAKGVEVAKPGKDADQESGDNTEMSGTPNIESSPEGHSTPKGRRSAMSTLRTTGSGKAGIHLPKRHPKPSFSDREAEGNAAAFSELPSNETEVTPRKARIKSGLPSHAPGGTSPSSSTPARSHKRKAPADGKVTKAKRTKKRNSYTASRDDEEPELDGSGFRKGNLTETEVSQVHQAMEEFRTEHGLSQYDLNVMIHENPKSGGALNSKLWQQAENACPTRKRKKLMQWSRLQFHNFVARGTWTEEQDEELRRMVKTHGTKWAVIGKSINRHQFDVRDRWRNYLVCGGDQKTSPWSEDEAEKLIAIISEALRVGQSMRENEPDNRFLGSLSNEQLVDWPTVSQRMGHTRSRLQCQEKWKRIRDSGQLDEGITALLSPSSSPRARGAREGLREMPTKDQFRLVHRILQSNAEDDDNIPWARIVRKFESRFGRRTLMKAWAALKDTVPDADAITTRDCAKYLVDEYEAQGELGVNSGDDEASDTQDLVVRRAGTPVPTAKGKGKIGGTAAVEAKAKEKGKAVSLPPSQNKNTSASASADSDYDAVPESESEEKTESDDDSSRGLASPIEKDVGNSGGKSASKANGPAQRRSERGGSRDLSMDADVDMDEDREPDSPSPSRKAKEHKVKGTKRITSASTTNTPTATPRESRKRPRAEHTLETPLSVKAAKQAKRARFSPKDEPENRRGASETSRRNGVEDDMSSSGMSDMEDIPARVHRTNKSRD